jgi:hypothetical protein
MGISTFPSTTVATGKKLKFNPSLISNSIQLIENTADRSTTTYGNGMFVIARPNRGIWTSTDGKNWKSIANNGPINTVYPSSLYWFDLVWNGSYWLGILSDGTLRKSTDLVNWTTPGSIGWTAASGAKLVYKSTGTATWLVVTNNSTTLQHLAYSTDDGVTWTNSSSNYQTATSTTTGRTYSAVWDGTNFIVVSAAGKIATSPDGANWTNRTNTFTTQNIYTVATNGTRVIAGTSSGNWAYSDDNGATWTANTQIASALAIYGMIWDGSRFVFMDSAETNFYYSTTGIGTATAGTTFTAPSVLQNQYARVLATNGSGVIVYQASAELVYTTDVTSGAPTVTSYNFAAATSLDTTNSAKSNSRFIKDGNGKYWMFGSTTGANGRPFVLTSDDKGATWSLSDNPWNKFDITSNARTGAFHIDFAGYVNNTLFTIPVTFNSSYYIKYSTDNGATATLTTPTSILSTAVVGLTHNGTYYVAALSGASLVGGTALQYSTNFTGPYTAADVSTISASATGTALDLRSYGSLVTCINNTGGYIAVSNDPTTFTSLTAVYVDSTGVAITPINNGEVKLVPGPNGKIVYFGSSGGVAASEKAYVAQANLFPIANPNGTNTSGGIYFSEVKYNGLEAATFKQTTATTAGMVCLYATYSEALGWVAVYKRITASHTVYYVITSPDGVNFTVNSPIDIGASTPNADYFGVLDDKLFMYSLHTSSNASIMIGTNGSDVVQIPL